jgi:hypothetical protein
MYNLDYFIKLIYESTLNEDRYSKEISEVERRVSVVPKTAAQLIKDGYDVVIESGAGEASYFLTPNMNKRVLLSLVIHNCSIQELTLF